MAASAGLTENAITLVTRAIDERDPHLISMLGTFPNASGFRRVLAEAGRLDEFRRQIGLEPASA